MLCSPESELLLPALRSARQTILANPPAALLRVRLVPAVSCLAGGTGDIESAERIHRAASVRSFLLPYIAILSKRSVSEQK